MTQTQQQDQTRQAQVLVPLTSPEEVDTFLAQYPQAAVFKAGTCHKTMQGFGVLETFLAKHELPVGFIRVVDWRPASNRVAELTGIQHQSPQFILFDNGQPVFDVDNWNISPEELGPVFEAKVPMREETVSAAGEGNVEPYKQLMQAFISGQMPDWEFQERYVNMFRDDASLRSQREFELLSKLFGDPDAYHGGLHQLGEPQSRGDLKARVQELLSQL
ncbi:monothiol bacilliredoxin BrxC family protein [Deinococcus sp.]|uniref:monothiol bacilliredoxin BrxC family protein n=1 Tax=Deinococcus sp. TaxID=47478 RepID=UPI003B5C0DCA